MSLRSPFYDVPIQRDVQITHIAHAADAGSLALCVFRSPCRAFLKGVDWVPFTAVTGTDTNYCDITIVNKGTDGNGDDDLVTKSFTAGINAADLTAIAIYSPAAGAEAQMLEGTTIDCVFQQIETGLAMPGGTFVFTYEPN